MSIRRGTTPTLTLYIDDINLQELKDIVVSLKQGDTLISKHKGDTGLSIYTDHVAIDLQQTETLKFNIHDTVDVQVKCQDESGQVFATNIIRVSVTDILDESVMS